MMNRKLKEVGMAKEQGDLMDRTSSRKSCREEPVMQSERETVEYYVITLYNEQFLVLRKERVGSATGNIFMENWRIMKKYDDSNSLLRNRSISVDDFIPVVADSDSGASVHRLKGCDFFNGNRLNLVFYDAALNKRLLGNAFRFQICDETDLLRLNEKYQTMRLEQIPMLECSVAVCPSHGSLRKL